MVDRGPLGQKARSESKAESSASEPPGRLFGQPNILEGEDAAGYDELLARIHAAVKPVDIFEEMFVADLASLQWEVLRWRRLKSSLIQTRGCKALQRFLVEELKSNYALQEKHFKHSLEEMFRNNLPQYWSVTAEDLAAQCVPIDADANQKLHYEFLLLGLDPHAVLKVLNEARDRKARELVQNYVRGDPDTVVLINELLTAAGASIDGFMADGLALNLGYIERIDRLTALAESRRNAMLSEIDRRRAVFGETLRQSVQQIEDAEFDEIEAQAKGKTAA